MTVTIQQGAAMTVKTWLHIPGNKEKLMLPLLCVVMLATGFLAGRFLGQRLVESVILNRSRFPLLLSQPVAQFHTVYELINSGNPFSRLSGYYGLRENGLIDDAFLAERFKTEKEPAIRRALAWVLSFTDDRASALNFYSSIYPESDDSLKRDLLRFMRRLDEGYYRDFIKKNRVEKSLLPE